jgi:hypothetical protein
VKFSSIAQGPYRALRPVDRSDVGPSEDLQLARASVLAQLGVIALCVARVVVDVSSPRIGIEGGIAMALVVVFAVPLTKAVIGFSSSS